MISSFSVHLGVILYVALGAEAEIVHDPSFESALVKIQDRKFEALTDAEQNAAKCLKVQDTVQTSTADDDQEYGDSVELMLKKRKMQKLSTQEKCAFKGSRFVLPTSNIIERFLAQRVMVHYIIMIRSALYRLLRYIETKDYIQSFLGPTGTFSALK